MAGHENAAKQRFARTKPIQQNVMSRRLRVTATRHSQRNLESLTNVSGATTLCTGSLDLPMAPIICFEPDTTINGQPVPLRYPVLFHVLLLEVRITQVVLKAAAYSASSMRTVHAMLAKSETLPLLHSHSGSNSAIWTYLMLLDKIAKHLDRLPPSHASS